MKEIYEAVCAHYERMITYNKREALVMNKCLVAISQLFEAIWNHKEVLIDYGIFDPLFESAKVMMSAVEERADINGLVSSSSEELTKELSEIVKNYEESVLGSQV